MAFINTIYCEAFNDITKHITKKEFMDEFLIA